MKIDLQIGYDDLSKECKEQIKNLKLLGFEVKLHYPSLAKNTFDWTYSNQYVHVDPSKIAVPCAADPSITISTSSSDGTGC